MPDNKVYGTDEPKEEENSFTSSTDYEVPLDQTQQTSFGTDAALGRNGNLSAGADDSSGGRANSQQTGDDATPVRSTRRPWSTHTVSFQNLAGKGSIDTETQENSSSNNDSVDNHAKRSMEIRMDGHVLELRQADDGTNVTTIIRPTTLVTNNSLSASDVNVTSATSLSWADSDDALDYQDDDDAETPRFRDLFNIRSMSLAIVKCMPCFWLSCFRHNHQLHGAAFSDRFILSRLNVLSFFFAAGQLAASVWLCVVLFVDGAEQEFRHGFHLWNNNGIVAFIGCLGVLLLFTCFWTVRIVKEVDLVGALRFLWLLLWILPIEAFLNIVAFDYHGVTSIWIIHYWPTAQLWWFRERFCYPGTEDDLCKVPIIKEDTYSEEEWCEDKYNTTGCTEIRDKAQEETRVFLLFFYRTLASWGCVYMFVIYLTIKCLERIISKPMLQKSREVNVVGWLTFPVVCTALFGGINLFSPFSYLDKLTEQRWVAYLYLIASGLFLIALLMGWFLSAFSIRSNTDKKIKSKAALILVGVLFVNAFVLIAIFVTSVIWSRDLMLSDSERGTIACTVNNSECTNCDGAAGDKQCPEWSEEDVTGIVRRQLKQSAILASIFILYDLKVMRHGLNLRKHLRKYEIDYV
eukprot:jgi/Psemu1/286351/fgenesh1_pg.130_\